MSELTECNFCTLRDIRNMNKDKRVLKKYNSTWGMAGINIYIVPKDVEVPSPIEEDSEFHKKYWSRWFMALSDRCCC